MSLSSRVTAGAMAAAASLLLASRADAQRRVLATDHPQARLMGYYAAVLAFTPIGTTARGSEIGAELTFVPRLSDEERRVGFGGTKYEDTNRCPVAPRVRATYATQTLALELGAVPPFRVCGVKAGLVAAAISSQYALHPRYRLLLRGSVMAGSLAADITCSEAAVADTGNPICFGGVPSDDRVKPLTLGAELGVVHGGHTHANTDVYVLAGVRRERVVFEVNFTNPTITTPTDPFDDHEQFQVTLTRVHLAGGVSYRLLRRLRLSGELFFAPGALTTVRGRASYALGGNRAPGSGM